MRAAAGLWVGLLLMCGFAVESRAAFLVLEDSRYVKLDGDTQHPDPAESLFASSLGVPGNPAVFANQASTVIGDLDGQGAVGTGGAANLVDSVFDVLFKVDGPLHFTLFGNLSGGPDVVTGFLSDSNGIFHLLDGDFLVEGNLQPDLTYRLFVGVISIDGGTQNQGQWEVHLVPEPASADLLALLGFVALARVTRRSSLLAR